MDPAIDLAMGLVKASEGFQATRNRDPAAKWQIGYGHLLHGPQDSLWGATLTEPQAADLAEQTLATVRGQLAAALGEAKLSALTTGQQAALIDFTYNEGIGRFLSSTLYTDIKGGKLDDAAHQFGRWIYGGEPPTILPGLVTRRKAEIDLWLS